MPDPRLKKLLSDVELVELAEQTARKNSRTLRYVKDDTRRDATVFEDRQTGERRSLPNKFIRAIGEGPTFELVDPELAASPQAT
jgi:hypothetical protein